MATMHEIASADRRRAFRRYLALQIPGWALVSIAGFVLEKGSYLPRRGALALLAFWVFKDLLLYPWLRSAYLPADGRPASRLIGARGLAEQELAPEGLVRIGRELWSASIVAGASNVPCGSRVEVKKVRGLKLIVELAKVASEDSAGG